jgi:hypothetical protein
VVLWLRSQKFAVILSTHPAYYLLKTAYVVKSKREDDFLKEWQQFQKTGVP